MFKTLITQTNWSLLGTVYGFVIGFFVKMYLVNRVGADAFGLYSIAQGFQSAVTTFIGFSVPSILVKFLPRFLKKESFSEEATVLSTQSLVFLLTVSLVSTLAIVVLNSFIAVHVFHKENLATIIAISALYMPLTMYMAYIMSVYRAFLKIKEIIIYGTLYVITIRALLTFLVYSFSQDIVWFMWIEIFSQLVAVILLTRHFHSEKMKLVEISALSKPLPEKETILRYGKTIYSNTLVSFSSGYILTFLMSILLPAKAMGIFAILGAIAGLTNFLQANINKVFAPIISTLVAQEEHKQLALLYRESTFLMNILTIPFILSAVLFSRYILGLYGEEFTHYTLELTLFFLANYFSLMVGSSGMMMMMGGLEKEELKLQVFQLIFVLVAALIFIPPYGLLAAILIHFTSMFIINQTEVYYIYKRFRIWPWDINSYLLIMIFIFSLFWLYHFIDHSFNLLEFISIPLFIYALLLLLFIKKLRSIFIMIKTS